MPELVAGLVAGVGGAVAELAAVVPDVADGAEVDDLAGLAEGDVLGLRLAQLAGEGELLLVRLSATPVTRAPKSSCRASISSCITVAES